VLLNLVPVLAVELESLKEALVFLTTPAPILEFYFFKFNGFQLREWFFLLELVLDLVPPVIGPFAQVVLERIDEVVGLLIEVKGLDLLLLSASILKRDGLVGALYVGHLVKGLLWPCPLLLFPSS